MTEEPFLSLAPIGSMPRNRHTPHAPVTTHEMVADALLCEEAGASVLHIHTRDEEQNPSDDPDRFAQVVHALTGRSKLIVQMATGGRAGVTLESRRERLAAGGKMASPTTGSVNFPRCPTVTEHLWEQLFAGEIVVDKSAALTGARGDGVVVAPRFTIGGEGMDGE